MIVTGNERIAGECHVGIGKTEHGVALIGICLYRLRLSLYRGATLSGFDTVFTALFLILVPVFFPSLSLTVASRRH